MAVSDITATVLRITGVSPTANSVEDAQRFVVSSVPKELLKWAATNLKATDLLAGEANTVQHPGGLDGAYIASEQRVFYSSSARTVIADITITTHVTAASAGETRVLVLYCCPPSDSVKP